MDYQDRYNELENMINSIDYLVDELTDKYYIDGLNELKFEAQNELNEVSEELRKQRDEEENQDYNDYIEGVI